MMQLVTTPYRLSLMRDQINQVNSLREQKTHAVIRQEGADVDCVNENESAVDNADSKWLFESKAKY